MFILDLHLNKLNFSKIVIEANKIYGRARGSVPFWKSNVEEEKQGKLKKIKVHQGELDDRYASKHIPPGYYFQLSLPELQRLRYRRTSLFSRKLEDFANHWIMRRTRKITSKYVHSVIYLFIIFKNTWESPEVCGNFLIP